MHSLFDGLAWPLELKLKKIKTAVAINARFFMRLIDTQLLYLIQGFIAHVKWELNSSFIYLKNAMQVCTLLYGASEFVVLTSFCLKADWWLQCRSIRSTRRNEKNNCLTVARFLLPPEGSRNECNRLELHLFSVGEHPALIDGGDVECKSMAKCIGSHLGWWLSNHDPRL